MTVLALTSLHLGVKKTWEQITTINLGKKHSEKTEDKVPTVITLIIDGGHKVYFCGRTLNLSPI